MRLRSPGSPECTACSPCPVREMIRPLPVWLRPCWSGCPEWERRPDCSLAGHHRGGGWSMHAVGPDLVGLEQIVGQHPFVAGPPAERIGKGAVIGGDVMTLERIGKRVEHLCPAARR